METLEKICGICLKLTRKTPIYSTPFPSASIIDFEQSIVWRFAYLNLI